MGLEALIKKRLSEYGAFAQLLAAYEEKPAVFYQAAPEDTKPGWGGQPAYPRIVFDLEMSADAKKKRAGSMYVRLFQKSSESKEALEPLIRESLRNILFNPQDYGMNCLIWHKTKPYILPGANSLETEGMQCLELWFDILKLNGQELSDPDPADAMRQYLKGVLKDALIPGMDRLREMTELTAEQPLIHCQLETVVKEHETNTVTWLDGQISIHILCPVPDIRQRLCMLLANRLSADGEIRLSDGSPMTLKELSVNHKADGIREGQILVTGHYGLQKYSQSPHGLTAVGMEVV